MSWTCCLLWSCTSSDADSRHAVQLPRATSTSDEAPSDGTLFSGVSYRLLTTLSKYWDGGDFGAILRSKHLEDIDATRDSHRRFQRKDQEANRVIKSSGGFELLES